MNSSTGQNVFLISEARLHQIVLFFLLVECVFILFLLTLGWQITFPLLLFLLVLLFCMINDSGYVYFLMLIAPIMVAFGIPYETMKFFKWASISIITFFVLQRILLAKGSLIIPKTRLISFMLFFLGLAIITTAFSFNVSRSILELLRILSLFVLFLLVFNTLRVQKGHSKTNPHLAFYFRITRILRNLVIFRGRSQSHLFHFYNSKWLR